MSGCKQSAGFRLYDWGRSQAERVKVVRLSLGISHLRGQHFPHPLHAVTSHPEGYGGRPRMKISPTSGRVNHGHAPLFV